MAEVNVGGFTTSARSSVLGCGSVRGVGVLPFPRRSSSYLLSCPFEAADDVCPRHARSRGRGRKGGESQKSFIVFDPLLVMNECDL
jgi:hypothetical protein